MSGGKRASALKYRQARGEVVSYLYHCMGTDTTTAADKVFAHLCEVADKYGLSDQDVKNLLKSLQKAEHEYQKKYL